MKHWLNGERMRYAGRIAALTYMVIAAGALPAGAQEPVTAFINVAVIPMDRERVLADQTVVIEQGRIAALGPTGQIAVPAQARRIDGRGKYLIPGLTDMHVHLGPGVSNPRAAAPRLLQLLLSGVTTVRNLDYWAPSPATANRPGSLGGEELLQLRDIVARGELWGPRLYVAGEWYADTMKSIAQNVEAYKAHGYDLIKVHHDFGWDRTKMERTVQGLAPERDAPLAKLDSLAAAARRVGMPIAGHPVGGLAWALEQRFASVEHLEGFPGGFPPARGITLADTLKFRDLVAATREAGVAVTPTLDLVEAAFGNFYSSPNTNDSAGASAAIGVLRRLVVALHDAGVMFLLGTDAPMTPLGKAVHQELAAFVRAGLTRYEALVIGTRNASAYFGTLDSTGTVAVGKRADLVLLAANPLEDIRHTEQIAGVMAKGQWLPKSELERRLAAYDTSAAPGAD